MINFKIPVNRHLFAGQLKTECLNEHLRHLPRCDTIIIKQEKKEKRFPFAWEVGHTNASNRCDFARPRVHLKPDSSQKLTLGAIHSTRGSHTACVHSACMHRYPSRHQLQRTDMIRRRVVPFQMSTSHQKNTRAFQTETNARRFTRWKGQVATCTASEMQC